MKKVSFERSATVSLTPAKGMRRRRDDNMRMIAEHRALKIEVFRRPAHDGEVEFQIAQAADGFLPVPDRKAHIHPRVPLPESGERLGREIFRCAHHARPTLARLRRP